MPKRVFVTCRQCGKPVKLSEARAHLALKCRVQRSQEVAAGIREEYIEAAKAARKEAVL